MEIEVLMLLRGNKVYYTSKVRLAYVKSEGLCTGEK